MQRPRDSRSAARRPVLSSFPSGIVKGTCHLRTAALGGICAAIVLAAPSAHADDIDFQAAVSAGALWVRSMPELQNERIDTAARTVQRRDVPIGGSVTALGGSFELSLVVEDRWVIYGFGAGTYVATGSYAPVITGVDGSIARIRPWTMVDIDLTTPGLAYRMKRRRWMFAAGLRTGVTLMHVDATVAGGSSSEDMPLNGVSFMLQAELEACRRLDPATRVCLAISPRVYDFGILNGGTLGLRMEWGR